MKISILLPYKENFTHEAAGAVSLFVHQIWNVSKYKGKIKIYGSTNYKKYLNKNYKNINFKKNIFLSSSKMYVDNFLNNAEVINSDIIEVHNRPHYIKFIKKKFKKKISLYFHNDPLSMDGSKSVQDRMYLIDNVDKLIFNSIWSKNRFFLNMYVDASTSIDVNVCYQSANKVKIDFKKKKNIISFIGKLNKAKGYDIFGNAIIDILNKYKNWKAIVIGDEEREKIIFKHPRLKVIGFKKNRFILDLLKKTSISVVCSRWQEPFGRASLEAASRGSAVIISNTGGLPETTKSGVILKSLSKKELVTAMEKLIIDKKKLLRTQKDNHKNFKFTHNYISNLVDTIREKTFTKTFNIKKTLILKILHITNFNNRFDGRLHYNTSKRLNNGFIRLGHNVLSISDRDIISNNKTITDLKGIDSLQKIVKNNFNNFKPDLVVLGHADSVNLETINYMKKQNIPIAQWFLDPVGTQSPDYQKNKNRILNKSEYIDASFLTSDPNDLDFKIRNSYYIPNPSDSSFETLNNYNNNCENDVFFAMSHGVHRGNLKTGKFDNRETIIKQLVKTNKNIKFDIYGMNQREPIWGDKFIKIISKSSMGLNLSRGQPVKYYSSDRIAQLMGNGLLTFIDKRTLYGDFFTNKEIILYKDINDLSYKINKYKKDHLDRKLIAKNGKKKYMKFFNSNIVCEFIINKTFQVEYKKNKFLWEK